MKRTETPGAPPVVRCPSCSKPVPADDAVACAICKRAVCRACLRPYGHHMLVCEECRLAEW
jgi:ribosomal protein S26